MKKLSAFGTNSHDNNFNLLRIILASLVIYSHSYVVSLGGQPQIMDPFERFSRLSLGHLSVNAFFVISGFLVTKSYTLKKSLLDYCIARILRIYPAFTVAILFSALVVGATFSDLPLYEYYKHTQTANYILHNLPIVFSQLEYSLPGVFTENPLIYTVNIPIWTLPWELKMYILLAFWGLIGFLKRPWLVASITSFFVICFFYNDYFGVYNARDIREGLQFLSFFYLGATVYLFRSKIVLSYRFLPVSFVLLALFFTTPLFRYIFYLSLVYWIFLFAYLPAGILRNYNKFGDYSYGMYVLAFPIQQSVALTWKGIPPPQLFLLSFITTLPVAVLSWHFIEKPLLKLKNKRLGFYFINFITARISQGRK